MSDDSDDTLMDRWSQAQKRIVPLLYDSSERIEVELEPFVASGIDTRIRREALSYRAFMREVRGDIIGARADLLECAALSPIGSFQRFVDEASLGDVAAKCGNRSESIEWYISALRTVLGLKDVLGAAEVRRVIQLRGGEGLTGDEHELCLAVVRKAWRQVFGDDPGTVLDLERAASRLIGKTSNI